MDCGHLKSCDIINIHINRLYGVITCLALNNVRLLFLGHKEDRKFPLTISKYSNALRLFAICLPCVNGTWLVRVRLNEIQQLTLPGEHALYFKGLNPSSMPLTLKTIDDYVY